MAHLAGDRLDVGALIENQKASPFQRRLVFWMTLTMMVEGNDNQVVGFAAPAMIGALHIDRPTFGAIFGIGLSGYMLGALALGAVADRFGRRWIVIAGALIFGAFTLATVLTETFSSILVLRFFAGIGLGAAVPSSVALMAEYAPRASRATRVSLMFVAYSVGAALGGLLAAWLIPRFGWQSVFVVGGLTGILLGVALMFTLPESIRFLIVVQDRARGGRDRLVRILRRLDPTAIITPTTRLVSDDAVSMGMPVRHLFTERRATMTVLLWIAYVCTQMTLTFMTSWLPTVVHEANLSLEQAEITTALLQFGGAAGSFSFGRLIDRRGVIALALGFLVAVPVVGALGAASISVLLIMPLATMAGFLVSGGQGGINALSGTIYPTYMRGTGSGWAFGVGRIGSIAGPVIGGLLLGFKLPVEVLFLFVAIPLLCVAISLFLLRRRTGDGARKAFPTKAAQRI